MSFFPRPLGLRVAITYGCIALGSSAYAQDAVSPAPTQQVVPAPQDIRPHGPVRISSGVMAGLLTKKVDPVYPASARKVDAFVLLHVIVGVDGAAQRVEAVQGPDELRAAAIDAVQQWRWKPYLLNGERTAVDTTVVLRFVRQ